MAYNDGSQNSLPYIDDTLTDDDIRIDKSQYNLRIIENFQNKGRNIEITNTQFDDITSTSLSPVAPLAEETDVSDSQEEEKAESRENIKSRPTTLKLIIKGCNSMISIQGLDNKSSITFRRKSERIRREKTIALERRQEICRKNSLKSADDMKSPDKSKKGRWRKLTRSLISKSTKFERKISDERYPKYVLLKNEEDEEKDHLIKKERHESYPKMVILNAKTRKMGGLANEKQKECSEKNEFSLKRSFKNKTEPVFPMDEAQAQSSVAFDKETVKPIRAATEEKSSTEKQNKITRKRVAKGKGRWEGEKSQPQKSEQEVVFDFTNHLVFQGNLFNEIQGILEEALHLYSDVKAPNQMKEPKQPPPEEPRECLPSLPPQICQFSCHDPHNCQSPMYIPVYNQYGKARHSYRSFYTQTNDTDFGVNNNNNNNNSNNNQNNSDLQLGILSSFFPGAVVMKTYQCDTLDKKMEDADTREKKIMEISNIFTSHEDDTKTLKVPIPDLTIKSKMVFEEDKEDKKPSMEVYSSDIHSEECEPLTQHQNPNSDEEEKTKAEDSEATEYLYYNESESQENESTTTTLTISKTHKDGDEEAEKPDDGSQDLSLTKVGYRIYDSLTKLSLSCEEGGGREEKSECQCLLNRIEKPYFDISVESNRGILKVVIPEKELMLRFKNKTEKSEIDIGLSKSGVKDVEEKTLVQKNEMWHPDNGKRRSDMLAIKKNKFQDGRKSRKDSPKIKLTVDETKEVVLSVEMDEEGMEKEKPIERATKEMKIGTDDIDLTGGDVLFTKGSNYQNLSPRTGQILKSLEEKLTFSERERKMLADKIKKKLEDDILERAAAYPGLFLVKQLCPAPCTPTKLFPVPCVKRNKKVTELDDLNKLREYYCEECLATMRIFEDENPSVKSMVDKFETIIHLDKY